MAKEKKMQVVEDDEIENVGIMSGFMDDIDGILAEIMEEEQEATSGEDDDMARVMGRTPDSPEILMNNLRGNMRSLDARREELAEMVGFSAAEETPDEVLAMLQPVLAEQEMAGIAGFSPLNSGSPQAPPESLTPPADAGGVLSLPMGQEPMPAPMPPAAPAPAPMSMKKGGLVQYFQDGSDEDGVTAVSDTLGGVYPAEVIAQIMPLLQAEIARQPMDVPASATERAKELEPMYADLLGVDKEAAKAQFLMNLGQSALRYAGNVGPSGERLSGSPLARLAAGFSDVPAAAAKAGANMAAQERQARLAALQGAQAEIASAQDYNTELLGRKLDIYSDILKQKPQVTYELATQEQKSGLPEADQGLPWQISSRGQLSLPGGRPPVGTTIDLGSDKFGERLGINAAGQLDVSYIQANSALQTRNTADELLPLIEEEGAVFAGPLSGAQTYINRLADKLNISDGTDEERLNNTVSVMQSLARFELQAAEAMRGQGQITEKERDLIRRTAAGQLTDLTQNEVTTLVRGLRKVAQYKIDQHNLILDKYRNAFSDDDDIIKQLSLYELTEVPLANFNLRTEADSLVDDMDIGGQENGN
jgi:hypothetical protein